jgi:hypothetical protein
MPITLECTCGKQFKVLDDLAGKRVKCPGCQEIMAVPGGASRAAAPAHDDEDPVDQTGDDREDGEQRRNPFKKKKKNQAQSGSRLGLWIALAGGVVVLGFCCLGLVGGGLFLYLRSTPERTLIGRWEMDFPAQQKNEPNPMLNVALEFRSDGTLVATEFGTNLTRQWKHVKTEGEVVTVDITGGIPSSVRATVTIIDRDHIRYQSSTLGARSLYFKRAGN